MFRRDFRDYRWCAEKAYLQRENTKISFFCADFFRDLFLNQKYDLSWAHFRRLFAQKVIYYRRGDVIGDVGDKFVRCFRRGEVESVSVYQVEIFRVQEFHFELRN